MKGPNANPDTDIYRDGLSVRSLVGQADKDTGHVRVVDEKQRRHAAMVKLRREGYLLKEIALLHHCDHSTVARHILGYCKCGLGTAPRKHINGARAAAHREEGT